MTESELREYQHLLRKQDRRKIEEFHARLRQVYDCPESFHDYMYTMIKRSKRTKAMIAQRAGLSRDYVYKILNPNSGKTVDERDYIIAMCLAADMSYMETQHALELYPFPVLDDSDNRSAVIIMALLDHIDIDELNELLENGNHVPLRTSPEMKKAIIGPVRSTLVPSEPVSSKHDEQLIAAVVRRMHMNKKENVEVWTEGYGGDCATCVEMKFTDSDGIEKFAQLFESSEVTSLSVSKLSLHSSPYDDCDEYWTSGNCQELWDTYQAQDAISDLKPESGDCYEDDLVDYDLVDGESHYRMMFKLASKSRYFAMYMALDKALNDFYFGSGEEIEAEEIKEELLKGDYSYTVICEYEKDDDSGNCVEETNKKEFTKIGDAVSYAEEVYNSMIPLPEGIYCIQVSVKNGDGTILWYNGKRY